MKQIPMRPILSKGMPLQTGGETMFLLPALKREKLEKRLSTNDEKNQVGEREGPLDVR